MSQTGIVITTYTDDGSCHTRIWPVTETLATHIAGLLGPHASERLMTPEQVAAIHAAGADGVTLTPDWETPR